MCAQAMCSSCFCSEDTARKRFRLGELFHSAGGKLVLITDSVDAPLTDIADATVTVYTGSASYADSPTAVAAVCHLLSALTSASAKGARRRLAVRDQLAQDLGLYAKASRPRSGRSSADS
jgi:DNA-binding MurR/RpiR family transcriptional regulator